jgi:PAS domain S-box-containing protein
MSPPEPCAKAVPQCVPAAASEEELVATLEGIGDGFLACDAEWRLTYVNAEAELVLGICRSAVLGRSLWDAFPLTKGTPLEDECRRAAGGLARDVESCLNPAGRWFHCRCFPRRGGGVAIHLRDVTEYRRTETALRERVTEQRCLYAIVRATEDVSKPVPEMLTEVAEILPTGWCHPKTVAACIEWDGRQYATAGYASAAWRLSADLSVDGAVRGKVTMAHHIPCRRLDEGPFLPEERALLDTIAVRLSTVLRRRELAERLREEGQRLSYLLSGTPAVIYTCRATGDYGGLSVSENVRHLLGYESDAVAQDTTFWTRHVHPDDAARVLADSADLAAREGWSREYRFLHRNGTYRWMLDEARVVRAADGRPAELIGSWIDITERRHIEDELRMTRISVENTPDAIFWVTPDTRIADANPAACRTLGYTREELARMRVPDVNPHCSPEVWQQRLAAVRERGALQFETEYRTKDGRLIPADTVIGHVRLGTEERLCAFVRDITERQQREQELLRARAAAEAGNRAKSEFLANMSHEIRTPINGIVGMTQLLGFTELTDTQSEYLNVIRKSSETLLSLINDILDLAKIEAGRTELARREFSLRESVRDIVNSQQYHIRCKGLRVQVDIPAAVPDKLKGDQVRLKQILLNLLGNAVKFTEAGEVTVTAAVVTRRDDLLTLQIDVRDTGVGIAPEDMDRIFAPFVQADASSKRRYGGTGLGLHICARLTELMGGRIWAESCKGAGSVFHVQLPFGVDGALAGSRHALKAIPAWDGPPLRVLVADDDSISQFVALRILKHVGHTAAVACNGEEALQKWEQEPFDAVLMDVQMPVMDGVEAALAIREKEKGTGRHTPIIALTARVLPGEQEDIMSHGFDGYVPKPLDMQALLAELRRHGVPAAEGTGER